MSASDSKAVARSESLSFFNSSYALWPIPLVNYLESRRKRDALLWAICIYESFLNAPNVRGSTIDHAEWLGELRRCANAHDTSAEFLEERLLRIWRNDPEFNAYERGISRLFTAVKDSIQMDDGDYRRQVAGAIAFLSRDPTAKRDSPSIHAAILTSFGQLT